MWAMKEEERQKNKRAFDTERLTAPEWLVDCLVRILHLPKSSQRLLLISNGSLMAANQIKYPEI